MLSLRTKFLLNVVCYERVCMKHGVGYASMLALNGSSDAVDTDLAWVEYVPVGSLKLHAMCIKASACTY